jgi:acetaldehyde dehydrogenase (acetylating)
VRHHGAAETRVLIAPLDGVGRDYPLSIEKLCPVLSYYVVRTGAKAASAASRSCATAGWATRCPSTRRTTRSSSSSAAQAGVPHRRQLADDARVGGLSTGLDPAMTLGCGGLRRQHHVDKFSRVISEHQAGWPVRA